MPDRPESAPTSESPSISSQELVLGVDGGGTKTTAWLARPESGAVVEPLGIGVAGPGNPRAVGFAVAQGNIAAAVSDAFRDARVAESSVRSACLGLAGAGRLHEQRVMREWCLQAGLAASVRVTHDAEITLAAGCPSGSCVALISGTGSLAWGRSVTGQTARAGGWGYLLGDEGSGHAIALAGLRAVVRAVDGRGKPTALRQSFLEHFEVETPADLIEKIYDPRFSRRKLADLSYLVFQAAPTDETARSIVDNAAVDLAGLVENLVVKLELPNREFDLAYAGGVLLHQPLLCDEVFTRLCDQGIVPAHRRPVANPVEGAVQLAMQLRSTHEVSRRPK